MSALRLPSAMAFRASTASASSRKLTGKSFRSSAALSPRKPFGITPRLTPLPSSFIGFIPFALLSPLPSLLIWSFLQLILSGWYLRDRWLRDRPGKEAAFLLLIALFSYPALTSLFWGQPGVLLMIAAGETLKALEENRSTGAGIILTSGFLLVGPEGIDRYIRQIRETAAAPPGDPYNPQVMMNWRALGLNLKPILPDPIGKAMVGIGSVLTAGIALGLWRSASLRSGEWALRTLAIFAATGAVAWHAHGHMAVILIPPILRLALNSPVFLRLFAAWAFTPWLATGAGLLLAILRPAWLTPEGILAGSTLLLWNLYLPVLARELPGSFQKT